MEEKKYPHSKLKICVSGAADIAHFSEDTQERAKELGREIAKQGAVLLTGATTGFPYWAAVGAKEAGGISIGFSPASNEREHVKVYKLPLDYFDIIVYTGFGYAGRDILLTRSSDAIIIGCGRIGTIHEFTIAFEDRKPTGILRGSWETDEVIEFILNKSNRKGEGFVVFNESSKDIVADLITEIKKQKIYNNQDTRKLVAYQNYDHSNERAEIDYIL